MASGADDDRINIWNIKTLQIHKSISKSVTSIEYIYSNFISIGTKNNQIELIDYLNDQVISSFSLTSIAKNLTLLTNGVLVCAGGYNNIPSIIFMDLANGFKLVKVINLETNIIEQIDNNTLAFVDQNSTLRLLDLTNWNIFFNLTNSTLKLIKRFSPDFLMNINIGFANMEAFTTNNKSDVTNPSIFTSKLTQTTIRETNFLFNTTSIKKFYSSDNQISTKYVIYENKMFIANYSNVIFQNKLFDLMSCLAYCANYFECVSVEFQNRDKICKIFNQLSSIDNSLDSTIFIKAKF